MEAVQVEVAIFGGGIAGLWLLDEAARAGCSCLLIENDALGAGQTIASQGIIHGGLKYTLDGLFSPSADAIRDMPAIWRACLAGEREPNLRKATARAEQCHLWRTGGLASRFGMIGARVGLRVAPVKIERADRPAALAECPGDVFRLDEQVIDVGSVLAALAAPHRQRILHAQLAAPVPFQLRRNAHVEAIEISDLKCEMRATIWPTAVVLAAGAGNADLRQHVGLPRDAMQRRPLHMVTVRGGPPGRGLPILNGHCTEATATRITVTSVRDSAGRTVWQIGGQLAEDGVRMERDELITRAKREIAKCIPGVDLSRAEWATYRIDRAEPASDEGKRPAGAYAVREGNVITAWPTKLALAPQLAANVLKLLDPPAGREFHASPLHSWPRPEVARPPWETESEWTAAR